MSATITLRQRDAVHLMVDGLGYHADGRVAAIMQKAWPFPTAAMAVTSTGPVETGFLAGFALVKAFGSFDAIVAGAGEFLPDWYGGQDFSAHAPHPVTGHIGEATLTLVGWSTERRRPEAYFTLMAPPEAEETWTAAGDPPFKLKAEEHFCATPFATPDEVVAADFRHFHECGGDLAAFAERIDPDVDLLHFMEIQRRHRLEAGFYGVGGLALLTTVRKSGITQRVVHRWTEDQVGELIQPRPIDWGRWRRAQPAHGDAAQSVVPLASAGGGLSRQQRRAAARAAR